MQNTFELNPLDINIVQMQLNLIKRLGAQGAVSFAPVIESFMSRNPLGNLAELRITFTLKAPSIYSLKALCADKRNGRMYETELFSGGYKIVFEYINSRGFFEDCKKFIVSNGL